MKGLHYDKYTALGALSDGKIIEARTEVQRLWFRIGEGGLLEQLEPGLDPEWRKSSNLSFFTMYDGDRSPWELLEVVEQNQAPVGTLTELDVRRIVAEELQRLGARPGTYPTLGPLGLLKK